MLRASIVLIVSVLVATGCTGKLGIEGASCNASADCEAALQCMQNVCVDPLRDAPPSSEPEHEHEHDDGAAHQDAPTPPGEPRAPKASSKQVSAEECRAFANKVVELTVKGQEGAAVDMARSMIQTMVPEMEKECMSKGTKDEILCALEAHSLEELEQCDKSTSAKGSGSRAAPSELSCRAYADKIMTLTVKRQEGEAAEVTRSMLEAMKPELIKECIEKKTQAEIDSALRATSIEELAQLEGDDPC